MATLKLSFAVSSPNSNPIRFDCFAPQCLVRIPKPPCLRRRLFSTRSVVLPKFQREINGGGGGLIRCELPDFHLSATATSGWLDELLSFLDFMDVLTENSVDQVQIPKGEMWSVHKFGGTCVGNSQRIRNVAEVIINDNSERKLVVVEGDRYDLIRKAQFQKRNEIEVSFLSLPSLEPTNLQERN